MPSADVGAHRTQVQTGGSPPQYARRQEKNAFSSYRFRSLSSAASDFSPEPHRDQSLDEAPASRSDQRSSEGNCNVDGVFEGLRREQSNRSVSFSRDIADHETMAQQRKAEREGELEAELEAESSADETTWIASRRRGSQRRDYGTRDSGQNPGNSSSIASGSQVPPGVDRRSKRRKSGSRRDAAANGGEEEEEEVSWWKKLLEKYGSVELENKGSVARDHLALGLSLRFSISSETISLRSRADLLLRTNLPCLAQNVAFFCIHWHCRNPALPPQHVHFL